MNTDKSFDAAIIGLGPIGATLANLLAAEGLKVVALDRERSVYDKPRAIGIDHESMRVMQFCGVADSLGRLIEPFRGSHYLGVDGKPIKVLKPSPPPYQLGWPPNSTFIQPEYEQLLRGALAKARTATILLEAECNAIRKIDDRRHELTLLRGDTGTVETINTRYVFGCDGAKSFVRKYLETTFDDLAFDEWWVVVDTWLKDASLVPETSRQYCWPSRPVTYVVGPRDLRRWEFKVLPGESPDDFDRTRIIETLKRFVPPEAVEIWRTAVYRFHAVVAHNWGKDGVWLLGDAAHQTPPFMGQGMNSGIRDAANLAWKITMVLKRSADPALLDTYEVERKPHFRRLVEIAKEFGLIIGELDPKRANQRDDHMRSLMASGQVETFRHRYVPGLTTGLIDKDTAGAPADSAGMLCPQPSVKQGDGEVLLDSLLGMRFVLMTTEPDVMNWLSGDVVALLDDLQCAKVLLTTDQSSPANGFINHVETAGVFTGWAREKAHKAVLVRPDRYIYGTANDAAALAAKIRTLHQALFSPQRSASNERATKQVATL